MSLLDAQRAIRTVRFNAKQWNINSDRILKLPSGGHGLNGYKGSMWGAWQTKSLEWLALQKMIPHADTKGSVGLGK